jgi:hypothetical protein
MQMLWSWSGEFFGYRSGDSLFTLHGREVGRFHGDEICNSQGRYIGEVNKGNRLVTTRSRRGKVWSGFKPRVGTAIVPCTKYVGYTMYVGYEAFLSSEGL